MESMKGFAGALRWLWLEFVASFLITKNTKDTKDTKKAKSSFVFFVSLVFFVILLFYDPSLDL